MTCLQLFSMSRNCENHNKGMIEQKKVYAYTRGSLVVYKLHTTKYQVNP